MSSRWNRLRTFRDRVAEGQGRRTDATTERNLLRGREGDAKERWSTKIETHFVVVVVAYFGRTSQGRFVNCVLRIGGPPEEGVGEADFRRTAEVTSGGTAAKFAEKMAVMGRK